MLRRIRVRDSAESRFFFGYCDICWEDSVKECWDIDVSEHEDDQAITQSPRDTSYLKTEVRREMETTRRELNEPVECNGRWFMVCPFSSCLRPIASKQVARTLSDYIWNCVISRTSSSTRATHST